MPSVRYLGHPVIQVLTTRVEGCSSIMAGEVREVSDEAAALLEDKYPGLFEIADRSRPAQTGVLSSAAAGPTKNRAVKAPAKKRAAAKPKATAKPKAKRKTTKPKATQ